MQIKKIYIANYLFLFIFLLTTENFAFETTGSKEILAAANMGLINIAAAFPSSELKQMGMLSQDELSKATLGEGFQIYTIDPETLINDTVRDLNEMAFPIGNWRFLIKIQDNSTAIMTVEQTNDGWEAVKIGASFLAHEIDKTMNAWPKSEGYAIRFIRIFQSNSDFIEISKNDSIVGFVPLTSAIVAMNIEKKQFDPLKLKNSEEIINKLRPIIKEAIQKYSYNF